MPLGHNSKTGQFEFPEERDHNSKGRGPPPGLTLDDDEPASEVSSDLMVPLPIPIAENPGYTVQYTLKMLGIIKGWSGMHSVRPGDIFPLTWISKKAHQEAFQQARSLGQISCILMDVEAEVLYTGQASIHALRTTFESLEPGSWDAVITSINVLFTENKKRQIRVNLIYSYHPKALEVTDSMLDALPSIKRDVESVRIPGDSPAKKGRSTIIDQYRQKLQIVINALLRNLWRQKE